MRAEGIYDSSLILLIADTGAGLQSAYIAQDQVEPVHWGQLVGRANPILLVKAPGARGRLRENPASVQISDVAATVCSIVKDCVASSGRSVFDRAPTSARKRNFHYYRWRQEYWGRDVIPAVTRYSVQGPIWERPSWIDYDRGAAPK